MKPPSAAARGSRTDGFGVLPAGFAQVGVEVDQTRQCDETTGLQHHRVAFVDLAGGADALEHAVTQQQQIVRLTAIKQGTAHQMGLAHAAASESSRPPSNRYSTAIRTLTLFVTC